MSYILFLIFLLFFSLKNAFNINTNNAIIYENPSSSLNSLFGYSLVLYPPNGIKKSGLFVGAPAGSLNANPTYKNGVLYQCPILEFCAEISKIQQDTSNLNANVAKFWNGGSIEIDSNFDRVVTCASRSINVGPKNYFLKGACYWFHLNENETNQIQEIQPLFDNTKNFYTNDNKETLHYYSYGQSGFSVHMVPKEHKMVITAPGMLNSIGSVILYKDSKVDITKNNLPSNSDEFQDEIISNPTKYRNRLDKHSLFGYSVASGKFYRNPKRFYVAGSPRSSSHLGEIHIFEFNDYIEEKINFIESKKGRQFGEYFGSSLTVGDVNNDRFDDLIVGAPFYTSSTFNEGRVYIFLGGKEHLEPARIGETISGPAVNGQFGTTLQFLGDLNKDGFGDVAIAAPYELENSGVVYIFEGSEFGLNPEFTQRIVGREVFSEIRGFGISISRAVDIDNNNYLDLAIGAHLSGHVAVLRTNPYVQVIHSLTPIDTQIERDSNEFQVKACFWFYSHSEAIIKIRSHIRIDKELERAQLKYSKNSELLTLNYMKTKCQTLTITLKESVERISIPDIPIKISLWHSFESTTPSQTNKIILINPSSKKPLDKDNFCAHCVVYDKNHSSKRVFLEIPFSLLCGKDNICNSYLEIEQKISNLSNKYFVLGSSNDLNLEIIVSNSGEDNAYHSYFILSKPEIITFRNIPENCEEKNSTVLQCDFTTAIKNGSKEIVTLQLDFLQTPTEELNNSLLFSTTIFTHSQNANPIKTKILELEIRREADMKITGNSEQETYSFGKINQGKPSFTQIFQVEKLGASPIDLVEIIVNIPETINQKKSTGINLVGDLNGEKLSCKKSEDKISLGKNNTKLTNKEKETFLINCNSENIICSSYTCLAGPFSSKNAIATIELKLQADFNFIIQDISNSVSKITFTSEGMIRILSPRNFEQTGEEQDFTEISSHFIGDSPAGRKVAIWVIIVSVCGGLLLLVLVTFGLIKIGFFKRNTKEELEKLKLEEEEELSEGVINDF